MFAYLYPPDDRTKVAARSRWVDRSSTDLRPDPNPAQPPEMEAWEECAGQQAEERVRSVLTNVVEKLLEDEIKLNGWRKTKFANDRVFERIVKALRPVLDGKTSQEDAAGDYHVNPFNRFLVSTN